MDSADALGSTLRAAVSTNTADCLGAAEERASIAHSEDATAARKRMIKAELASAPAEAEDLAEIVRAGLEVAAVWVAALPTPCIVAAIGQHHLGLAKSNCVGKSDIAPNPAPQILNREPKSLQTLIP